MTCVLLLVFELMARLDVGVEVEVGVEVGLGCLYPEELLEVETVPTPVGFESVAGAMLEASSLVVFCPGLGEEAELRPSGPSWSLGLDPDSLPSNPDLVVTCVAVGRSELAVLEVI